ncbi:olfactory receptor 2M3-like [Thomomys bottae]
MYYLLSQLSLTDLMYICTTVPKMAFNFLSGQKGISFLGCGTQMFFFSMLAGSEGLFLSSMAYDRFVAICHPLHYPIRMISLFGNSAMIFLIRVDSRLHIPMYFLLSQLSLTDLLYICTTVPKMVFNFLSGQKSISFLGCGFFLFMLLMGVECLLLAVMAYDRYVAVCHPLHYSILMRPTVSASMVTGTWLCALLNALAHVTYTMNLPYCSSRQIHHFFCEISALLRLVCMDTSLYENSLFISGIVFLLFPILAILASYGKILSTVVGLRSNLGKRKALTTCSSHVIVVSLFYGTAISKYFLPKAYHSAEQDEVNSIFYTILTPMLNPLIYSLRNKEVAGAFRKVLGR